MCVLIQLMIFGIQTPQTSRERQAGESSQDRDQFRLHKRSPDPDFEVAAECPADRFNLSEPVTLSDSS